MVVMQELIQFVTTGRRRTEGYFLLETILAFSLLLLIISIIPLLVNSLPKSNEWSIHQLEIQLFFQQLAFEIRETDEFGVEDGKLILYKKRGEEVTIEKYQDKVRRRVFGEGNEIMLQTISNIEFQLVNNGIYVRIIDKNGDVIEQRISKV